MKNRLAKVLQCAYEKIINVLKSKLGKHIVSILSHGFIHFCVFIVAFALTFHYYNLSKYNSETIAHQIMIGLQRESSKGIRCPIDSITTIDIEMELNSNTVAKKNEWKKRNRISIRYNTVNNDSIDGAMACLSWKPYGASVHAKRNTQSYWLERNANTQEYDTIFFNYDAPMTIKEKSDSTISIDLVPSKNTPLPSGKMVCGTQDIQFYCDDFAVKEGNPYYYYFIGIDVPETASGGSEQRMTFSFQVGDNTRNHNQFYINQNKDLRYVYIFPEPDLVNGGWIYYYTPEKADAIRRNHGVVIQAEDVKALNESNQKSFLYSVLVGMLAAFSLDVFIHLIRKWKNMNR